jgi:hypothetical protein
VSGMPANDHPSRPDPHAYDAMKRHQQQLRRRPGGAQCWGSLPQQGRVLSSAAQGSRVQGQSTAHRAPGRTSPTHCHIGVEPRAHQAGSQQRLRVRRQILLRQLRAQLFVWVGAAGGAAHAGAAAPAAL